MSFVFDDGGREAAGFRGDTGDCAARAMSIALGLPYADVYAELADANAEAGRARSMRYGIYRKAYDAVLARHGWQWVPTMRVGEGCRVHLRADELPAGRIIARVSKHFCAVIDGVVHDTQDPARGGTRCVYGYYTKEMT